MADPYRTAALRAGRRPNLYIPEENVEWQEGQALIGPEAAWRRNYEFVLQQTGDPQKAEAAANSIARTERRQELTQLATSVAGPVMRSGELATGLARTVMGGSRAAEAPAAMRALPPPLPPIEPRAPIAREPMVTPDVIPMGGPLRDAPQIGYIRPEQRYTMRDIRQPGERAGPPTRYQMEARESARRPVRDETYIPLGEERIPKDVVSDPGGIPTMNTEGRLPVSNAPKWANERLAQEQRIADAIAEGNIAPDAIRNQRALSARDEALFLARQQAQAADDGMGALSGQYRRQPGTAVTPAQSRALESIIDKHFGAPTVAQAEGRSMAGGPTYFAEVPTGGPKLVGESFAGPQAPGDWYRYATARAADPAGAGGISPLLKYGAPAVLAGGAGVAGYNYASSNGAPSVGGVPGGAPASPAVGAPAVVAPDNRESAMQDARQVAIDAIRGRSEFEQGPDVARQAAIDAIRGRQEFEQGPIGSGRGSAIAYPTNVEGMNNLIDNMQKARRENAAMDSRLAREAAASRAAASQAAASSAAPSGGGFLSKIFGQPASTRELFQRSVDNPDDAGAWMRAERQYARTHRDEPNFDVTKLNEQGMKRGGSAGGKQDSVHKALEIIHHLIAAR